MIGERLGYRAKTGLIAATGGLLTGGSVIAEKAGGENIQDAAETINWFGKVGLFWAGIRVVQIGAAHYAQKMRQEKAAELQAIEAKLPLLEDPLSPTRIMSKLWNDGNETLASSFFMTGRAWRSGVPEDGYLAKWSLQQDVERLVQGIVDPAKTRDEQTAAHGLSYQAAWLLDKAAPISTTCTSTPSSGEERKYWADFIDRQVAITESSVTA